MNLQNQQCMVPLNSFQDHKVMQYEYCSLVENPELKMMRLKNAQETITKENSFCICWTFTVKI